MSKHERFGVRSLVGKVRGTMHRGFRSCVRCEAVCACGAVLLPRPSLCTRGGKDTHNAMVAWLVTYVLKGAGVVWDSAEQGYVSFRSCVRGDAVCVCGAVLLPRLCPLFDFSPLVVPQSSNNLFVRKTHVHSTLSLGRAMRLNRGDQYAIDGQRVGVG